MRRAIEIDPGCVPFAEIQLSMIVDSYLFARESFCSRWMSACARCNAFVGVPRRVGGSHFKTPGEREAQRARNSN